MNTAQRHLLRAAGLSACRRLGVLLVLAGVVAMHALGSGSHMAMAGAPGAARQPSVSVPGGEPPAVALMAMSAISPAQGGAGSRTATVSAQVHAAAASSSAAAGFGSGTEAACVAVLLGLVLLAARAAVALSKAPQAPAAGSAGHSSTRAGRGPPRDLLARICVLRT